MKIIRDSYFKMHPFFIFLISTGIVLPIAACSSRQKMAESVEPAVIETLISATESWNGDSYYYPKGKAEITLQRITAQPGFRTTLHSHSQPGIAYVFKGNLSCRTVSGEKLEVGPGENFATPQDSGHYCESVGDEAAIVFVTSAGVKGVTLTIPYQE